MLAETSFAGLRGRLVGAFFRKNGGLAQSFVFEVVTLVAGNEVQSFVFSFLVSIVLWFGLVWFVFAPQQHMLKRHLREHAVTKPCFLA